MPVSNSTAIRKVSRAYRGSPLQTVRDSTSTGTGLGYDFGVNTPANYAIQCVGASTAWRASLQGSLDGTNWQNILTGVGASATPTVTRSTMSVPFQFLRTVATAGTTSTAVAVNVYITANAAGVADESTASSDAVNVSQFAGVAIAAQAGHNHTADQSVTSTGAVTVLAANANREFALIQHTSTSGKVRITLSTAVPTATKGIELLPGAAFEIRGTNGTLPYRGVVKAIRTSTGTAKVGVTESS